MIQKIVRLLEDWRRLTQAVEALLVDNLAATSPWLAPVIPAYLAWRNMTNQLGFPAWVAVVGAIVVETLGLATVHTVFTLWDYNDSRRKNDQAAPAWVAILVAVIYIGIVLTVNVLLDYQRDRIQLIALSLLSMLSVVASLTLAIRANHGRRLGDIEADRAERREMRKEAAERDRVASERSGNLPEISGNLSAPVRDWRNLPESDKAGILSLTAAQVASRYGVTERTARSWRASAALAGQNGNGHHEEPPAPTEEINPRAAASADAWIEGLAKN